MSNEQLQVYDVWEKPKRRVWTDFDESLGSDSLDPKLDRVPAPASL